MQHFKWTKFKTVILSLSMAGLAMAYIVQKGDTLWDLSGEFFGDPFTWPGLWEINPHIQNPHLIYPGDSLNMDKNVQPATVKSPQPYIPDSALPSQVSNSRSYENAEDEFRRKLGGLESGSKPFIPKRSGKEFIAAEKDTIAVVNWYYLAQTPIFSTEGSPDWGQWINIESGEPKQGLVPQLNGEIILHAGNSSTNLDTGNYVYLVSSEAHNILLPGREIEIPLTLHKLVGVVKLSSVGKKYSRGHLVRITDKIEMSKVRALEKLPHANLKVKSYTPVNKTDYSRLGQVIYYSGIGQMPKPFDYVVINRGRSAGLKTGDGVAFWENDFIEPDLAPRNLGSGVVLWAGDNYSTIILRDLNIAARDIQSGTLASKNWEAHYP